MAELVIRHVITFSDETLRFLERMARPLAALLSNPPSPASPAQPVAPGSAASVSLIPPAEGPSRAAGTLQAARAKTSGTRRSSPKGWLTEERAKLLDALWPTETTFKDVRQRMVELPGPQMPDDNQVIRQKAFLRGLKRPASLQPIQFVGKRGRPKASQDQRNAEASAEPLIAPSPAANPDPAPAVPAEIPPPAAPLPDRRDAIREAAARLQPNGIATLAGREAIWRWAEDRGMRLKSFDLDAINARAHSLGHPGFVLKAPRG